MPLAAFSQGGKTTVLHAFNFTLLPLSRVGDEKCICRGLWKMNQLWIVDRSHDHDLVYPLKS